MTKTVAVIQARMGSTRLPGKVMMKLGTGPILHWVWSAARNTPEVDEVIIATSTLQTDDIIHDYCVKNKIRVSRGSESDVLLSFIGAAEVTNADIILRLTADCPFLDPAVIGRVASLRAMTNADYATNTNPPTWPDGLDVECFTRKALLAAHKEATRQTDRDCVTRFIVRNRHRFPAENLVCPLPGMVNERWVLDTEDDLKFCQAVAERLSWDWSPSYMDILRVLEKEPELRELNSHHIRNERFYEAMADEPTIERSYSISQKLFERASKIIPFGAQTFSKSHLQFPSESSPLFLTHGDGAYAFDVDGNDYVDLVGALLPNVLGYRDPDVDAAIRRQLDSGISFSLATEMESQLAERLIEHIPCAEMVKFGKNGSDVTAAAVRLARAVTGRKDIMLNGYHGWHDFSIGASEKNLGGPSDTFLLSHKFSTASEAEDLLRHHSIAAVIIEPDQYNGDLRELQDLVRQFDTVFIFDEIITGFRWSLGGFQKYCGVTPDLACFGKAMCNGTPISALVGRADLMKRMQPPNNIFYSGTFFGETLSIAAAIATIDKIERENVIGHLRRQGTNLCAKATELIHHYGLARTIRLSGTPPLVRIEFFDHHGATKEQIKTLFIREMIAAGVLIIASNNLSFAHKEPEIRRVLKAYDHALGVIIDTIERGDIARQLGDNVIPLKTSVRHA